MSAQHKMSGGDAVAIIEALEVAGVDVCLSGGWSVDALVGHQTRIHAELGVDRWYPWGDDRPLTPERRDRLYGEVPLRLAERSDGRSRRHWGAALHLARRA